MTTVQRITVVLSVLVLGSCAMSPAQQAFVADRQQRFADSRPKCFNDSDCQRVWSAAQSWVATRCGMKIQTLSDSIIQTYTAVDGNMSLHCSVVKEPIAGNGYVVSITTGCGNLFGCVVDPWAAAFDFNSVVQAAAPFSVNAVTGKSVWAPKF